MGQTSDARLHRSATQANNEIVSKKEAEELNSLHTALENAGIANLPGKEEFAKLPIKKIEALAEAAEEKAPSQEDSIRDLFFPVSNMKAVRKEEEEKLAQENLRGASFQATIEPTTELKETEHSPPKKESNRVTFKDAMELKNESIKEKNEEQTWRGNLANRIKGVGRVLYAIPAIPIEGAKGIFNAVRSVPVMAGGALKASWGAIRGNQELKENGISMMSAGGHMALQGVTAFIRAPASLIKEGVMNIATGQRQENTFRAKQHATRITREKGKGNLTSETKQEGLSKTTQKFVKNMRSNTAVGSGTGTPPPPRKLKTPNSFLQI